MKKRDQKEFLKINNFKKGLLITIIVILIFIVFSWLSKERDTEIVRLSENGILVMGRTKGVSSTRSGANLLYEYTYENVLYKDKEVYHGLSVKGYWDGFHNKLFPVIVDPENPSVNSILIFDFDFEKFERSYPDSLKWTKAYYLE
jgi:hypothetical protein